MYGLPSSAGPPDANPGIGMPNAPAADFIANVIAAWTAIFINSLITNLEKEVIGYRNTYKLINDLENFMEYLPEETQNFYKTYRKCFE